MEQLYGDQPRVDLGDSVKKWQAGLVRPCTGCQRLGCKCKCPRERRGAGWLDETQSQGARGPVLHSGDVFTVHSII